MIARNIILFTKILFVFSLVFYFQSCSDKQVKNILDHDKLASQYFGEDAAWYRENIPFFECSDKEIEAVYYYRWQLYKAHIRSVGDNSFVITEFINHVSWDREPYCTINAASMHHIYEGRWLRDQRYMDSYIDYLYKGGNDRRYSESIADAAYARYLVNADSAFIVAQLDSMKSIYDQWADHWEEAKQLYYIPAMPDATEFNIAAVDASGGKGGFEGGEAFRPTINSYMYGNALAISHIATMKGSKAVAEDYRQRAEQLKSNVEANLWNESFQHFMDRYKVNNEYVHYWNFIRGRELAGFAPWYFDLPADNGKFTQAWKHLTDTTRLLGKFGFRTNEPSYQYYFTQFLYHEGKRGSQWNGPSWPFQTSIALTGMSNALNDYNQNVITKSDYLHSLRLFTKQHYLPDGTINLVENYDPNIGEPIVHYRWSNHYNHSSYNNLIITGLCGIRPSKGNQLTINPLIDNTITYFCLDGIPYHGRTLTVIYDKNGTRYNQGKGLTLFVDGKRVKGTLTDGKYSFRIGAPVYHTIVKDGNNIALNIRRKDYPIPSASVNSVPDSLYQAIDGRFWYFPEITNGWSTAGSDSLTDWYAIDFGQAKDVSSVRIYPFVDNIHFGLPDEVIVEYDRDGEWLPVKIKEHRPAILTPNTVNKMLFENVTTSSIRINFSHKSKQVFLSEIECY